MTIAILILTALVLLIALLYLTLATNDFEKSTRELGSFIQKRYVIEPPNKANDPKSMKSLVKLPGKS
ncbi:MAG: hypothetical protein JWO30_375 [Fibrobacteres bacterium]|nr:hypothetical protein [Fibrobacterota bacterium]